MKKYLRELPDPVIPEQFYTSFIDAASKFDRSLAWHGFTSQCIGLDVAEMNGKF